jgi:hypothetical protein
MVGCYQASVGSGSGFAVFEQCAYSSQVSVASHCRFKLSLKCEKVKLFLGNLISVVLLKNHLQFIL